VHDGVVCDARVALGGVATIPWRAREAEGLIKGQRLDDALAQRVAEAAFAGAKGKKTALSRLSSAGAWWLARCNRPQ
jgi:xanthine dehydrogenase YagS FAD-binding subunit